MSVTQRSYSPYKNLIAELDKRNLTYRALGELMGATKSTIARKMRGEYNFNDTEKAKLVEIFDKPIEYLLQREDGKEILKRRDKHSPYKNLLRELDARSLTYLELEKLIGAARKTVSAKMRCRCNFTEAEKAKLVEIFGKPIEYLLERTEG